MEQKGRTNNFIIPVGAPSGDLYLPDYYSERFVDLHRRINEQKYTISETSISYRVINHWDKAKLFPDDTKKNGKWRKFSLVEMAWLKIVQRLRVFGLSLDKIARAKKLVMEWKEREGAYFYFEYYIALTLFGTGADTCVIVLSDGTASLSSLREFEMFRPAQEPKDMIVIPLRPILLEMGWELPPMEASSFMSEGFRALRNTIYWGDNDQILLKVKDGKITEIETKSTISQNPEVSKVKDDFKERGDYGKYTVSVEGGKQQSIEVIKRKRFKQG